MAWIPVTIALLEQKLLADEFVITEVSLPEGQTAAGIVEEEISRTINLVRGHVAANKGNRLGDLGTIPDELLDAALVITRYKLFTRLPNMKALNDQTRVDEYEGAMRLLRDVAADRFAVVPPVAPAPEAEQAGGSTLSVVSAPKRRHTRDKLGGLF